MEEAKGKYVDIKLIDGIVHVVYKFENYDEEMIDLSIKEKLLITKDKSYPMFSDARKVKRFTREARQRMAQDDAAQGVIAVAILINSRIQEVIYNFFCKIYTAPSPSRLFTDQEKAIEWLQQFRS